LGISHLWINRAKDIISPAQSVVMKLLAVIFRSRQAPSKEQSKADTQMYPQVFPAKCHVNIVKFLLTEFRRHIIPQCCALIFLQGQIHQGLASPEDFPLNLWDMERMYEGVYQYLEFFAILTEHERWKKMMAEWEITSEFVTLLKELDNAIPKGKIRLPGISPPRVDPSTAEQIRRSTQAAATMSAPYDARTASGSENVVAVERPYEVDQNVTATGPVPPNPPYLPEFGHESPADEPAEFEWRNLKKLTVLVLTSLVWKSRVVQDQVRERGGIETILNCCVHDEHNPYIREHAIMCLRFLLEGNKENQKIIRDLEARGTVPSELLDQQGFEPFIDEKGQLGIRAKPNAKNPPVAGPAPPPGFPTNKQTSSSSPSASQMPGPLQNPFAQIPQTVIDRLNAETTAAARQVSGNSPNWKEQSARLQKLLPKDPNELAKMVQMMMNELPDVREKILENDKMKEFFDAASKTLRDNGNAGSPPGGSSGSK
jgi:palmitoyltransferase